MLKLSSFLCDIDCVAHVALFPQPFLPGGGADDRIANSRLRRDALDGATYDDYVVQSFNFSYFPYFTFCRVAKAWGLAPFAESVEEPGLSHQELTRLFENDALSASETWAIVASLYLLAQDAPNYESLCENLARDCRIPDDVSRAFLDLARSRDWKVASNGREISVEKSFCDAATELIVELVKRDATELTALTGLKARVYQNPADRAILRKIAAIPGVGALIEKVVNVAKRPQELFLLANNQFVTPQSNPKLSELFWTAAQILRIDPVPPLFIDASLPGINAYTTGSGEKAYVALSPQAASMLDERELLFILGHELGHIQCDHVRYHALADVMLDSASFLPGVGNLVAAVSKPILMPLLSAWLRCSELSADRAGLLCCQNREAALRAFVKMGGLPWSQYGRIRTRTLVDQTNVFLATKEQSGLDRAFELFNRLYASHPYLVYRAAEMLLWIRDDEYDEIVATDAKGREMLARRVLDDPKEQEMMKSVERFVVDWHMNAFPRLRRKAVAAETRRALYLGETPTLKPLNTIGQIELTVAQTSADSIEYRAAFYTLNEQNEVVKVEAKLDCGSGRDDAPASIRAELMKNGGKPIRRVLYALK